MKTLNIRPPLNALRSAARSFTLCLVLAATAAVTHAQDVTLNPIARGVIRENDAETSSYTYSSGASYWYAGRDRSGDGTRVRPFFVFDLPPAPAGKYIASASLRLYTPTVVGTPDIDSPIEVHILNVDCFLADLANDKGATFADLGDGPSLGFRTYKASIDGGKFTEIPFNLETGLDVLNRATGLRYALSLNTLDPGSIRPAHFPDTDVGQVGNKDKSPLDDGYTQLLITWGDYSTAPKGSIGATVYDDHNGNGVQDPGEPGLAGVTVNLDINADGTIDASTATDASGHYLFSGLTPGLRYQVQFLKPGGYEFTQPKANPYVEHRGENTPSFFLPLRSVAGDFNGDGKLDVFSLNDRNFLNRWTYGSIVYGYGDGTFTVPKEVILSQDGALDALAVGVADFDKDGRDDVAVGFAVAAFGKESASAIVKILFSNGNPPVSVPVGPGPLVIRTGDLNGDTYPDLVVHSRSGSDSSVTVLLNNGSTLTPGAAIPLITQPGVVTTLGPVALGDFNNDSKLDLLVGTISMAPRARNPTAVNLSVLLGDGTGGFGAPYTIVAANAEDLAAEAAEISVQSVEVGDFNHDGKLDAILSTWSGVPLHPNQILDPHPLMVVAFGDGTGRLGSPHTTRSAFGPGINLNYITVADLNGDAYPDVVDYHGFVYYGDGSGHFQQTFRGRTLDLWLFATFDEVNYSTTKGPVVVADFDGDGGNDLIAPAFYHGPGDGNEADNRRRPFDTGNRLFLFRGYSRDGFTRVATLGPDETIDVFDQGLVSMRIDLEKFVNGDPADDPSDPLRLTAGDPVLYTYVLKNVSDFTLGTADNRLVLLDDNGTPPNPVDDMFYSVTDGAVNSHGLTLTGGDVNGDGLFNPGETWTFSADPQTAAAALVTSTARAFVGTIERGVDTASYVGRTFIDVTVDWKPGSNPSAINLSDTGTTPAAILGSSTFDVSNIDISSIRANDEIADGGIGVAMNGQNYMASFIDFNNDGFLDLIVHFDTASLGRTLLNDSTGIDPNPTDDTLYILGMNGSTLFVGSQQAGDPVKLILQ